MLPMLQIKESEKLLIVAPHPDDETIGCGGVLFLYGPQCDVLLLTDGRKGIPEHSKLTEPETAEIRKNEFMKAMDMFNVHSYRMLNIPDAELTKHAKEVASIDLGEYDAVFVPNRNERHPDHKAAYEIIRKLCKKQKAKAKLIEYEVWSPIISANRFIDVSDIMDRKVDVLRNYASQTASIDYEAFVKGLNMYRGAPHHVEYCEAYYVETKHRSRIIEVIAKRLQK